MKRIHSSDDYFKKFIQDKIGKWPALILQDFIKAIYSNQEIVSPEDVFRSIRELDYKKETTFEFCKDLIRTATLGTYIDADDYESEEDNNEEDD